MNEWMLYRPNIRKFQCWEEESSEGGDQKEEGGVVEGKVSYSVSGDLQIMISIWFPENLILNKYLELSEVQNDIGRRCGGGRWSLGRGEEKWRGSMRGWREC